MLQVRNVLELNGKGGTDQGSKWNPNPGGYDLVDG